MPRANYTVLRVKRNVFSQSTIGGIFLNREGGTGADYNRTAGVDLNLVLSPAARLTGLVAKTFTPGVTSDDWAAAVDFAYQKDTYNYDLTYLDVQPLFNDEMGYIKRVDTRNTRVKAFWTPRPRWSGIRQLSIGGLVDNYDTHAGVTESRTSDAQFGFTFNDTSLLTFDAIRDYDLLTEPFVLGNGVVPMGEYRWTTAQAAFTSSPRHRLAGTGYVQAGTYYNGDKSTVSGSVSLQATAAFLRRGGVQPQPDPAAGHAVLRRQHRQHAAQLLVLADVVREGIRAVQRRAETGVAQPALLEHLPARQRFLRRVQRGVGHGAHPSLVTGSEPVALGETHLLAVAIATGHPFGAYRAAIVTTTGSRHRFAA